METLDLITVIICSVFTLIGLLIVILQKKDIVRPVATQEYNTFHMVSGGTITFAGTIIGALMISKYSDIFSVLYVIIAVGLYIIIQEVFRRK